MPPPPTKILGTSLEALKEKRVVADDNMRLQFVILMTDTWRVKRCIIIIHRPNHNNLLSRQSDIVVVSVLIIEVKLLHYCSERIRQR